MKITKEEAILILVIIIGFCIVGTIGDQFSF